jgi:hypothetical protein
MSSLYTPIESGRAVSRCYDDLYCTAKNDTFHHKPDMPLMYVYLGHAVLQVASLTLWFVAIIALTT